MANVPTQGFGVAEVAMRDFGSGTKFIAGDTLLARITPCLENGKSAFVDFLSDGQVGWGSTEFAVLRPKLPLPAFQDGLKRLHDLRSLRLAESDMMADPEHAVVADGRLMYAASRRVA